MHEMLKISVIIPTYNPRRDYLERTLDALRNQVLCKDKWELLLVDNASDKFLSDELNLTWHPHGRVIRENELGLTSARIRGIRESIAPLLVLVDDDNVLDPDYLSRILEIAEKFTVLGAWSGQVIPEFEIAPPSEIKPFLHVLCIREFARDTWSNSVNLGQLPFGAGMCIRRHVAEHYEKSVVLDPNRLGLDRKGNSLASSGDLDIGLASIDLNMGTGLFKDLKVTHLISARRLTSVYILKLIKDSAMGHYLFEEYRKIAHPAALSGIDRITAKYKLYRASQMQKAVHKARLEGINEARLLILSKNL